MIDEAHHSPADTYQAVIRELGFGPCGEGGLGLEAGFQGSRIYIVSRVDFGFQASWFLPPSIREVGSRSRGGGSLGWGA